MTSTLGNRMKQYEQCSQSVLTRRVPVMIRIDGKAFHTWTKGLERPFSQQLHEVMGLTAQFLCRNIQNARIAYYQSDEISILLNDWQNENTCAWFDNKVQKIVSVSASMATYAFNQAVASSDMPDEIKKRTLPALFDSRAWSLPKEEVCNYFIWRQQDASRNSVQMLARAYFSHSKLHGKNNSEIQDMLMNQHEVNWNDIDTWKKRGSCITSESFSIGDTATTRSRWVNDDEIPIFTQDRGYIERHLE